MAMLVNVTPLQPVTITAAGTTKQSLSEAIDVTGLDILDLELVILAASGTVSSVNLITGLQVQTEDGWLEPIPAAEVQFTLTSVGSQLKTFDKGFLTHIRWSVVLGSASSVTFYLRGVGRRYGA